MESSNNFHPWVPIFFQQDVQRNQVSLGKPIVSIVVGKRSLDLEEGTY